MKLDEEAFSTKVPSCLSTVTCYPRRRHAKVSRIKSSVIDSLDEPGFDFGEARVASNSEESSPFLRLLWFTPCLPS